MAACGTECALNGLGSTSDHLKIGPSGSLGLALSLLPVPQCVDTESESRRELCLRESELHTNCTYVNLRGNVDPVIVLAYLTLCVSQRLSQTTTNATCHFTAHRRFALS